MASKKELQRLKRPDYFQTKMMAYLDRLQQHRNVILSLVGVIILAVAAVFAWQYYQDGQTQKRLSDLYVIDKMFRDFKKNRMAPAKPFLFNRMAPTRSIQRGNRTNARVAE